MNNINLSQLTEEQLNELELQIQKHKKISKFSGYKVTFYVKFNPEKHTLDMLTNEGQLDEGLFSDYLNDEIATKIMNDFNIDGIDEDVSSVSAEVATREELANIWGEDT
jgi:hypothetical protein